MRLTEYFSSKVSKCYKIVPGILLTIIIGFIASVMGQNFPLVGGAVFAILFGVLLRNLIGLPVICVDGVTYTLKKLLKVAIVFLGFGLSFSTIIETGFSSLFIVVIAVLLGFFLTYLFARVMGIHGNIALLIGAGTGICGATAIATTGPVLKAKQEDMAYAINTIFAFNVLAVFLYPLIGEWLSLSEVQFGTWAGAAIHDTSSVVAAGYMFGDDAGNTSVVVKLLRTLMLIPMVVAFAVYMSYKTVQSQGTNRQNNHQIGKDIAKAFPTFILLFVFAVFLNTFLNFSEELISSTNFIAKFLIIMVMASVGLETNLNKIRSVGMKPLLVGLVSSILMGTITLALIYLLF